LRHCFAGIRLRRTDRLADVLMFRIRASRAEAGLGGQSVAIPPGGVTSMVYRSFTADDEIVLQR